MASRPAQAGMASRQGVRGILAEGLVLREMPGMEDRVLLE